MFYKLVKVKTFWFAPDWVSGQAIWPFIFMKDPTDTKLLEHEKQHLRQQLRGFLIGFYIKYFYYNWKYGYKQNPYEVEARKVADDFMKSQG